MSPNRRGKFAFERNAVVVENRHEAKLSKMKFEICPLVVDLCLHVMSFVIS